MTTLHLENIRFAYHGAPLLDGLDLEVAAGEIVCLLGPSGVGKSTLLRVIAGLESAAGTVRLGTRDLGPLPPHERKVGLLFQEPALFPHLDARENVAFGLRYRGMPRAERFGQAEQWLKVVGLDEDRIATARVDQLSGGQRQRVALARTLAAAPEAVLLDEPLSALDKPLRDQLGPTLRDLLKSANVPVLWVTHDPDEARRLGDRVLRLVDGRLSSEP